MSETRGIFFYTESPQALTGISEFLPNDNPEASLFGSCTRGAEDARHGVLAKFSVDGQLDSVARLAVDSSIRGIDLNISDQTILGRDDGVRYVLLASFTPGERQGGMKAGEHIFIPPKLVLGLSNALLESISSVGLGFDPDYYPELLAASIEACVSIGYWQKLIKEYKPEWTETAMQAFPYYMGMESVKNYLDRVIRITHQLNDDGANDKRKEAESKFAWRNFTAEFLPSDASKGSIPSAARRGFMNARKEKFNGEELKLYIVDRINGTFDDRVAVVLNPNRQPIRPIKRTEIRLLGHGATAATITEINEYRRRKH